jgi:hypothetical protein
MRLAKQTSVTDHGNLKTVLPVSEYENIGDGPKVSGYENIGDRPKSGKTLSNMCHFAENAQRTCAISERATTANEPVKTDSG